MDFVRLWTVTAYPLARRCPHIDRPMTPVPIQPRGVAAGEIGVGAVIAIDM